MDSYEATKIVFTRIQNLDPENASKIMGYILIQDHGDKEMIRLALATDTLLHSLILKAKTHLRLSSSSSSVSSSPKLLQPLPSYASVVNGQKTTNDNHPLSPSALPFYIEDHLSFLNDSKCEQQQQQQQQDSESSSMFDQSQLQRSFSMPSNHGSSSSITSDDNWKPCLYYARGFCKMGTSCRFVHCDDDVVTDDLLELHCNELIKAKALATQQHKLAHFMATAAATGGGGASFPYNNNKYISFLLQQQNHDNHRSALMMGDEFQKFSRCRPEIMNPASRQIYLTFPADSTFSEEDVSNYFSIYGPVQDVRIPYQQKRMFGFVTFIYPETVKLILGKGNPHFVCDSRVLVKPYKEKGKVAEKKLQQQIERGNYSACSSPVGLDSREPFDFHLGVRMLYNQQEMLLRRNLEERADLQHAMEIQGRRLMKLQVLDFNNPANRYHHHNGSPIPSPHTPNNHQSLMFQLDGVDRDLYEENKGTRDSDKQEVNPSCNHNNGSPNTSDDNKNVKFEEGNPQESLEHILPDNLFASPKKSAGDHQVTMFSATTESDGHKLTSNNTNNNPLVPSSETDHHQPKPLPMPLSLQIAERRKLQRL
ncbi:hypothetical protein ACFE04_027710 [Oxalis oulophora]